MGSSSKAIVPTGECGLQPMTIPSSVCMDVEKEVFLIRHAESMENVRVRALGKVMYRLKRFRLPNCSDVCSAVLLLRFEANAPLSKEGMRQLQDVKGQLRHDVMLDKAHLELVAHSPLERAAQTCKTLFGDCPAPKVELSDLLERSPCEYLRGGNSFPQRVKRFRAWLAARPETRIAVVGHGQFFRKLLAGSCSDGRMSNAEVRRCRFSAERGFSNVETLYVPRPLTSEER